MRRAEYSDSDAGWSLPSLFTREAAQKCRPADHLGYYTIACDFPELKIIGIHTGWPWVEEMISVAWKHPNVYIGSDAYAPKFWKPEFIQFINSWGQDKVLFGTDFPIIDFERATREINDLGLKEDSKQKLLWKNTAHVYGLSEFG